MPLKESAARRAHRGALQGNEMPLSLFVLAARARRHLKLKLTIAVCLLVTIFGSFYVLERWPLLPVTYYSESWLDRAIPFMPIAAWPYLSLWLYIALAALMLVRRKDCWRSCWIMAGMGLIANIVFLIHPSAVPPRPAVSVQPYAFIVANDETGNACPSLHVAFTLFAAVMMQDWLSHSRRHIILRAAAWIWALAIIFSTMAIRQHLAIDVAWGVVLGLAGILAWYKGLPGLFRTGLTKKRPSTSAKVEKGEQGNQKPSAGTYHPPAKKGEAIVGWGARR
jgi:membrane-associated phospholipid phosphatase